MEFYRAEWDKGTLNIAIVNMKKKAVLANIATFGYAGIKKPTKITEDEYYDSSEKSGNGDWWWVDNIYFGTQSKAVDMIKTERLGNINKFKKFFKD